MSAPPDNLGDAYILVVKVDKCSLDTLPVGIKMKEGKIVVPWSGTHRCAEQTLICEYEKQMFRFRLEDLSQIQNQHGSIVWENDLAAE